MTSLFQILKASKTGLAPDLWTALRGSKYAAQHSGIEREYTGTVPTPIKANGSPLIACTIYGDMQQSGTPTPSAPVSPAECGDRTAQLFDKSTVTPNSYISDATGIQQYSSGTGRNSSDYIDVSGMANVYISTFTTTTTSTWGAFYDSNKTYISGITRYNTSIPVPNNAKYLRIIVHNDYLDTLMLNEGLTALPFEPHGVKFPILCGGVTTNWYSAEPLRKIGDYADYKSESAEYRTIKKLVLTGQENYTESAGWKGANTSAYYTEATGINSTDGNKIVTISSHFKGVARSTANYNDIPCVASTSRFAIFRIETATASTAAEFKQWVADQYANGTPVCVWYVLAEATTESIEAPEIPTVKGSQTFNVNTTLAPSQVSIRYKE